MLANRSNRCNGLHPPNINFKRKSQTKMMADAQKSYHNPSCVNDNEKVHIPETFEDSDSDSGSFGLKVQMLIGMGDASQSTSRKECEESNKHLWFMETHIQENVDKKLQDGSEDGLVEKTTMEVDGAKADDANLIAIAGSTLSPEIFLTDDVIINTQESVEIVMGQQETLPVSSEVGKTNVNDTMTETKNGVQQVPTRRRSERLKKDANLTTMEKIEKVVQKNNLEGNPKTSNSFCCIIC
jgi:hypothetical protein